MATHSSVLAWRIPGTGEPGGLLSMESHRVRHDGSDLAAALNNMRDLNSLTRDRTHAPAAEVQSVNHWTVREVPYDTSSQKS